MLTTDAVGGVWTYSLDLARALVQLNDTVVLLAVLGPAPSVVQLTEATAIPGLQVITTGLPLDWSAEDPEQVRAAAEILAELSGKTDAELAQLHSPALAVANYPVPVISVVHSCVATWWDAVRGGHLPGDLAWRAELVREGLGQSDRLVAPTLAFARTLQDTYRLKRLPTAVHNGRSPLSLTATTAPADYAFTAGRLWDAGKNVAAFDRAAGLSSVPFRAAGPIAGPNGTRIHLSSAEALGTLPSDRLTQSLSERPIFVSPSLYEPFGLAVLEAAQAGCALVLADRPGFQELWGDAALFVDPHDEHAIAAAVDGLIATPARRSALGEKARAKAACFTPERTARAMLDLYAQVTPATQKVAA